MTDTPPVRLYLDVDGVLLSPHPDKEWGGTREAAVRVPLVHRGSITYQIAWPPRLLEAIEELRGEHPGLELTWLTTWCDQEAVTQRLVPTFGGPMQGGWVMPFEPERHHGLVGAWKAASLIAEQAGNDVPYIWFDDIEVPTYGPRVAAATSGVKSLVIAPSEVSGLSPRDIARMKTFLEQVRDADHRA